MRRSAILASTVALGLVLAACSTAAGDRSAPVAAGDHDAHAGTTLDGAAELREGLRELWEDHIAWTRLFIVSAAAGLDDQDATAQRLLRNQDDIGNAIKPYYGEAPGTQLTNLLREHILVAADLLAAAKAGDTVKVGAAKGRWYANADEISTFLAKANPNNWPFDAVRKHMRTHLDLTLEEAVARLEGRFAADIAAYDKIHASILELSDALAAGIVAQFPDRFSA